MLVWKENKRNKRFGDDFHKFTSPTTTTREILGFSLIRKSKRRAALEISKRFVTILLLVGVVGFFGITGCDSFSSNTYITLKDGRRVETSIQKDGEIETLVAFFEAGKGKSNKRAVEKDAWNVWNQLKHAAEEREIEEGILNYIVTGVDGKKTRLLFTAEKIENGGWLIRSAN